MSEDFKYVGKTLPMHDASAKVSGKLRYTGDLMFDGMLHARLLFSPLPHARIVRIDASEALNMPGVIGVYSYENTPQTPYNSQVWFEGQQASALEDERMFTDTVRHVGDKVAAVLAVDARTACRALAGVKVEYEELPVILDPEKAWGQDGVIHPVPEPFFQKELRCGEPEKIFQQAELVTEDRIETPKVHHAALEPHVCIAIPDPGGKITVMSPCQIIYAVRLAVAKILGE